MPSLSSLPIEIWLQVIKLLQVYEKDAPITGVNAGWTKLASICPVESDYAGVSQRVEPWHTATKEREKNVSEGSSALWDLRQVCKVMNELCLPYLFQTFNFLRREPVAPLDTLITYGQNIRSIRILIDPFIDDIEAEEAYHINVAKILRACTNLKSIALYYRLAETSMELIAEEVFQLMKNGKVEALGVYSILVLHQDVGEWWWNHIHPEASKQLLDKFFFTPQLTRNIRKLDVVIETMNRDAYDAIRMHFPRLESLTLRRSIRSYLDRFWDPCQRNKWHRKPKLTHLHIIDCLAAYAPHIPELVRLFDSLKCLTVSTCGDEDDVKPPFRTSHWSSQPDALCKLKDPLESFHIEHMEDWEILALGIIPAKHIILSNITRGHFIRALEWDSEIFPHLETLSVAPLLFGPDGVNESDPHVQGEMEDKQLKEVLETICKRRGVTVRHDGHCIKASSGDYGFA